MGGRTFAESLNQDAQTIKTPAVHDDILKEWLMLSKLVLLNSAGQPIEAQLDAWNRFAATIYATDGAIDSLGARADAAQTDPAQAATTISLLKGLVTLAKTLGTETTLQAIQAAIGAFSEKDLATQTTAAEMRDLLGTINTAVAQSATEATVNAIIATLTNGSQTVHVAGSLDTLRSPVVGRRTVTATAAEVFAGASRLAQRRRLVIRNEDSVLRCLIGPSTITQQNGFPIEPGAVLEIPCDPAVAVPVYVISEGASLTVAVMEI